VFGTLFAFVAYPTHPRAPGRLELVRVIRAARMVTSLTNPLVRPVPGSPLTLVVVAALGVACEVGLHSDSKTTVTSYLPHGTSAPIYPKRVSRSPNLPLDGQRRYTLTGPLRANFSSLSFIGMRVKTSRLPRRYDDVMKTLRGLLDSKTERIRFQAAMRMSEILLEHQRAEERVTIATERAAARKSEAEAGADAGDEATAPQTAEEAARAFLASITKSTNGEINAAD